MVAIRVFSYVFRMAVALCENDDCCGFNRGSRGALWTSVTVSWIEEIYSV